MPKIKWAGKIDDISAYQKGNLSQNAQKMKMPQTMGEMMIKAIPFLIMMWALVFIVMLIKTMHCGERTFSPLFIVFGVLAGFPLLLVHELLHGVVYPKDAVVHIGIIPKNFAAVALASYPLSKARFILMSLLPFILGIIPLVLFIVMPSSLKALNGFLFGMAIMGMISPYSDCYNVYQVLKQAPKTAKLQFYGDDLYYISE